MAPNLVTLLGTYDDGEGHPLKGYLQFVPSAPLTDTTDPEEVRQEPVPVLLRHDGTLSVDLYATDDADLAPAGWCWQVTEHIDGLPASSWAFFLAFANGSTQDISSLTPVSPVPSAPAMTGYLPVTGGTITGPLTLPGNPTAPLQAAPKQYVDAETTRAKAAEEAAAQAANNLSDLASESTARTNLGLGSAATLASSAVAQTANNLSDLASASTAVTNLGLGTAATQDTTAFDAAGTAAAAQSAAEAFATSAVAALPALAGDLGNIAASPQVLSTHLSAPLPLLQGGTAAGSQQAAINTLTGTQAAGEYLRSDGTNAALSPLQAADLTGTLPVSAGGTGSGTQNFVDLITGQAIAGTKTFSGEVIVPAPVNSADAATKAYVDAVTQGLQVKAAVQEATTTALPSCTYDNGASGIGATLTATSPAALVADGQTVALNDRVLVQNQAAQADNGIYVCSVQGDSGTPFRLTRSADMNTPSSVPAAYVFVQKGTLYGGSGFTVNSAGPYTIGTTAITWTQFSSAGTVTAGTGLSQSGSTIGLISPVTILNGGTGESSAGTALAALGGAAWAGDIAGNTSASPQVTSTHLALSLPITQGGTGAGSASAALTALGGAGVATANTFTADQYFRSGRPWFDVAAFGADPTGATDSSTAWSSASTAVIAAGGGIIFFPPGTYQLSGMDFTVFATAHVRVHVIADGTTIMHNASGGGVLVNFSGIAHVAGLIGCSFTGATLQPKQSSVNPTTDLVYMTEAVQNTLSFRAYDPGLFASPAGSALHMFARSGAGVYYNTVSVVAAPLAGSNHSYAGHCLTLDGSPGTGTFLNSNTFPAVQAQFCGGNGINDLGSGVNIFHYVDCENNTGYGISVSPISVGNHYLHAYLENNNGGENADQWSLPTAAAAGQNFGTSTFTGTLSQFPTDAERSYWCTYQNPLGVHGPSTGDLGDNAYYAPMLNGRRDHYVSVTSAASPYTTGVTDLLVLADSSGGNISVVLDKTYDNETHIVKKNDASSNIVTVTSAAATIDGAASYLLTGTRSSACFTYNKANTNWVVTATGFSLSVGTDTTASDIQPDGTQGAGASSLAAAADHVHPENMAAIAGDYTVAGTALKAWNYDVMLAGVTGGATFTSLPAAGTVYLARINIRAAITPAKIVIWNSPPSGGSPSGYYLALFNSSGTQLGSTTSDQTAGSSGFLTASIGTPGTIAAGTFVYVALLIATQGSTKGGATFFPQLGAAPAQYNGGTTSVYRWAANVTAQTSMPSSLTLSGNGTSNYAFWCGLQ